LFLTGCAQHYAMTPNTGAVIYSKGKPKLDRGWYTFKDGNGQEQAINALRVRSIEVQ